jgi:hypothetical protein
MTEVQLERYRDGDTTVNVMLEVTKTSAGVERFRVATEATRVHPDGRREKIFGESLQTFLDQHRGQGRRIV